MKSSIPRHTSAIFSPSSKRAMKRRRSSIGLHSFQGIWERSPKMRKCVNHVLGIGCKRSVDKRNFLKRTNFSGITGGLSAAAPDEIRPTIGLSKIGSIDGARVSRRSPRLGPAATASASKWPGGTPSGCGHALPHGARRAPPQSELNRRPAVSPSIPALQAVRSRHTLHVQGKASWPSRCSERNESPT